jgi:hypothetical protein|tara:strand:+ start:413 stop:613 length:201 start_codon:yes stop_codon:yes gene_type:complete
MAIEDKPIDWDLGWSVVQLEHANWAVTFNGHSVEAEFASKRDAKDSSIAWEKEMLSVGSYHKPWSM